MPSDYFLDSNDNRVNVGERVLITSGVGLGDVCIVESTSNKSAYLRVVMKGPHNHGVDTRIKNHYRLAHYDYVMDAGL